MSRGGTAKRFDQEQIDDLEKQQTVSSTSVTNLKCRNLKVYQYWSRRLQSYDIVLGAIVWCTDIDCTGSTSEDTRTAKPETCHHEPDKER